MPREISLKTLEKQRPTFAGALEPTGGPGRASIGTATVGYTGYLPGMTSKICSPQEAQLVMSEGFIKAMRSHRGGVGGGGGHGNSPHTRSSHTHSSASVGGLTHFIPLQSPAPPRHIVGYHGHRPGMEEGAKATGQTFNRLERLTDRGYTQRGPSYEEITQYVPVPHNRPIFRTPRSNK